MVYADASNIPDSRQTVEDDNLGICRFKSCPPHYWERFPVEIDKS